jgi:hypothetical protein
MTTSSEDGAREYARTNPKHWKNLTAEDIPPGWIDDMVKRLFEELNRQMIRVERTSIQKSDKKDAQGNYEDDSVEREQHARVLSSLQRSMERLTSMEMARASLRAAKPNKKPGAARAEIRRQILGVVDGAPARSGPGESQ